MTATSSTIFSPAISAEQLPEQGEVSWRSPSNIALIKYWGKKPVQLPANPSLSFTLDQSYTDTRLVFKRAAGQPQLKVMLDGKHTPDFEPKIKLFFERIAAHFAFLNNYDFTLYTTNSFPHSSGIASSASGMSALALCLCSMEAYEGEPLDWQKASYIARLGSGSACRSVFGGLALWGKHAAFETSSDEWAIAYPNKVHDVFSRFQDTILLVDRGQKKVSSSLGHSLMDTNPFSQQRFDTAHQNLHELKEVLASGDLTAFGTIVEQEALMLHALMMTSKPYFILFKPATLKVIEKVWEFRESTGLHPYITLDAGANVHLLYPEEEKTSIMEFIKAELVGYCENMQYICDTVGKGPVQLTKDD